MIETSQSSLPKFMQDEAKRRGYRFEFSEDGNEERLIRPDGTVGHFRATCDGCSPCL